MTNQNQTNQIQHLLDVLQEQSDNIFFSPNKARSVNGLGAVLKRQANREGLKLGDFVSLLDLIKKLDVTVQVVATVYPLATDDSGRVWLMMGKEDKGKNRDVPTRIFPTGLWEPNRQVKVKGAAIQAVSETLPMAAIREFEEEGAYQGVESKLQNWGISLAYRAEHDRLYVIHHYAYVMSVDEMDRASADMARRWDRPEEERNPEERFETYDLERFDISTLHLPSMYGKRGNEAQIGGLPVAHRQDRLFWLALQKNVPMLTKALWDADRDAGLIQPRKKG